MIKENVFETENFYTTGFEVSNPLPMTIEVSSGTYNVYKNLPEIVTGYTYDETGKETPYEKTVMVKTLETDEYPAFTFNVVADDTVAVAYDVYLLDLPSLSGNSIHVDRTELGGNVIPHYTGQDDLRYILITFRVPPRTTDLADVDIQLRSAVMTNVGNNT